jgi:aspartokinase
MEDAPTLQKHISALNDILGEGEANATLLASMLEKLESDVRDVSDLLHTTSLVRKCSKTMKELIQSYGELWSSRSLYAAFTSHFRGQGLEGSLMSTTDTVSLVC